MVVAIAPWSIVLTPGKPEVVVPQGDLQIKNAALPHELQDSSARTSVKLTYQSLSSLDDSDEEDEDDDEPPAGPAVTTFLCSLTPGKIEQSSCEIILEQDSEYLLEAIGKNPIHLYGNYIDQAPVDQPPFGSDMDSDEEDERAYDLDEVSSDVEVEIDHDDADLDDEDQDDDARFEEIEEKVEEPSKNLKRSRDDAMEVDEHEEKLSKSQKKKLAKKLKAADGKAISAPVPEEKVEEKKVEEKKEKEKEKSEEKKKKKDKAEKKDETEQKDKKQKGDKSERTLDGGVKVRDATVGKGKTAKKGDTVKMRYIGKLLDGQVFDKNTKGSPFVFTLGKGEVIKGWDIGVVGMQVGGEREIVIPPSMGYGNQKDKKIPANSTLKFEVKLLGIK